MNKKWLASIMTVLLSLFAVACSGMQTGGNLDATVAARVQETVSMKNPAATVVASNPQSTPEAEETNPAQAGISQVTATPTLAPISPEAIEYFRQMYSDYGLTAMEMLDLKPPEELMLTHLDLAQKKSDVETAQMLAIAAALRGDGTYYGASALWDAANAAYDVARKSAEFQWALYLERYGLDLPKGRYSDLAFSAPDDGWIVGSSGTLLHYDGQSWQHVESPSSENLYSITLFGKDKGFMTGANSTLLQYDGSDWQGIENPSKLPNLDLFRALASDNIWLIMTDSADENKTYEVWHFDGAAWNLTGTLTAVESISGFTMLDDQTGWMLKDGNSSWIYREGRWQEYTFDLEYGFWDMTAITLLNGNSGWAVGDAGNIFQFDGSGWNQVESPTEEYLNDVYIVDDHNGWAVGQKGTILHFDGSAWVTAPCPVSGDLYSIYPSANGELHISGADDADLVLKGERWIAAEQPSSEGGELEGSYSTVFVAPDNAWALGPLLGIAHYDGTAWRWVYQWPNTLP